MSPPTLLLLTRPECELCERMLEALHSLARRRALPAVMLRDVDSDPVLRRRYGMKIPVLLLEGSPVCSGSLDEQALIAALAAAERASQRAIPAGGD